MEKYLDYAGLIRVWSKIKEKMTENNRITLDYIRRERAINGFCTLMVDDSYANAATAYGYGRGEVTEGVVSSFNIPRSNIIEAIIGGECNKIGTAAFEGCTSLTTVFIGNNVEWIGDLAFYNCPLTSVDIPGKVTYIGRNSFLQAETVKVYATTPPTITSGTFDSSALREIKVPSASVNAYMSAEVWSDYADIIIGM